LPWVIVKADPTVVGDVVLFPVDEKPMKMAIRPPRDQLRNEVKLSDGGVSANKKATPDEGTDTTQGNLELVHTSI
jgi:hypothetical protein